jgi:hypothetical protein
MIVELSWEVFRQIECRLTLSQTFILDSNCLWLNGDVHSAQKRDVCNTSDEKWVWKGIGILQK